MYDQSLGPEEFKAQRGGVSPRPRARLVAAGVGAAGWTVALQRTVAFRLYLVIIIQLLTN